MWQRILCAARVAWRICAINPRAACRARAVTEIDLRKLEDKIMKTVKESLNEFKAAVDLRLTTIGADVDRTVIAVDETVTGVANVEDDVNGLKDAIEKLHDALGGLSVEEQQALDDVIKKADGVAGNVQKLAANVQSLAVATKKLDESTAPVVLPPIVETPAAA